MASVLPKRRLQLQQHPHTPSGAGFQMLGGIPSVPSNSMPLWCCVHHQHQFVAIACSL